MKRLMGNLNEMKTFFRKPFAYAIVFSAVLIAFTAYVLLDAFVIPRVIEPQSVSAQEDASDATPVCVSVAATTENEQAAAAEPIVTAQSYTDANISVRIETIRSNDTDIYVADVRLACADYLKTALAKSTFGLNVCETTSAIAADCNAIFAVNGDYYGAHKTGYVIKSGTLYRDSIRSDTEYEDLVIYADGSFGVVRETEQSAESLLADGVEQLFCFGPALIRDGVLTVSENDEVARSKSSNPRTAIGIVDPLHYIFVVSDGRSEGSAGLTLHELAEILSDYGCTTAYNLDGGGSSTMVFMGRVVNQPTTSGKSTSERAVSDIVCIGY